MVHVNAVIQNIELHSIKMQKKDFSCTIETPTIASSHEFALCYSVGRPKCWKKICWRAQGFGELLLC